MKNINMNGIKSTEPTLRLVSPRKESASAQEKNTAGIKWNRKRQQRRWAVINAALSKNPKMTHVGDKKTVAKNLWKILDEFERGGHAKKEAVLREANMGDEGSSTRLCGQT